MIEHWPGHASSFAIIQTSWIVQASDGTEELLKHKAFKLEAGVSDPAHWHVVAQWQPNFLAIETKF